MRCVVDEFNTGLFRDRLARMRDERDDMQRRLTETMVELHNSQVRLHAALDEVEYLRKKRLT